MISVLQLGTIDYATGLSLQQRLVELRQQSKIGDVLLLLEHTPVITLGRNAKPANILAAPELLAQRGIEVFASDRGGDVTFHGPGQIVGYPIFDLHGFPSESERRKTLGAIDYVRRLEQVLIRTCADFNLAARRISGLTGVWTDPKSFSSQAEQKDWPANSPAISGEAKIAAIGVHISCGVTSHGFALNVSTDLSYFHLIVPCGITSKPVTSMAEELGKGIDPEQVAHSLTRHFGQVFESQILWLDSLDSLLGQTVGVPMKPAKEVRQIHGDSENFWA